MTIVTFGFLRSPFCGELPSGSLYTCLESGGSVGGPAGCCGWFGLAPPADVFAFDVSFAYTCDAGVPLLIIALAFEISSSMVFLKVSNGTAPRMGRPLT